MIDYIIGTVVTSFMIVFMYIMFSHGKQIISTISLCCKKKENIVLIEHRNQNGDIIKIDKVFYDDYVKLSNYEI